MSLGDATTPMTINFVAASVDPVTLLLPLVVVVMV